MGPKFQQAKILIQSISYIDFLAEEVRPGTTGLKAAALESIGPLLRGRGSGSESLWSKVIPGQFSRLAVRAAYPHYLSYEKADESLRSADFFEGGC
jgi:hypothetical protein